jgi:hypothetical protein
VIANCTFVLETASSTFRATDAFGFREIATGVPERLNIGVVFVGATVVVVVADGATVAVVGEGATVVVVVADGATVAVVGEGATVVVVVVIGATVVVVVGDGATVVVVVVIGATVVVVVGDGATVVVVVGDVAAVVWNSFVESGLHALSPTAFVALTAALYAVSAVKPCTVHEVAPVVVHVNSGVDEVFVAVPSQMPAV